jgi:hypothetical protein
VLLWPTGIVEDGLPPTIVNPVPVIVAWEMSTVAVPVLVTVTLCEDVLPTLTFPKLTLAGDGDSTPLFGGPGSPPRDAEVYPAQLDSPTIARHNPTASTTPSNFGLLETRALRLEGG